MIDVFYKAAAVNDLIINSLCNPSANSLSVVLSLVPSTCHVHGEDFQSVNFIFQQVKARGGVVTKVM